MIKIVLLGAGNVAKHLYAAFLLSDEVCIIQCYNRKEILLHPDQNKKEIVNSLDDIIQADLYIIAIKDDAISEVSEQLPFSDKLVVHTSGSLPMDVLPTANRKGVFYPLQTFSTNKKINYQSIPFCIEAEEKNDLILLKTIANAVSNKVYEVSSDQRGMLHIAAVFVNNFTNFMFTVGHDICDKHNIPFEILFPLMEETIAKIKMISPVEAQTGPAIRGDHSTIQNHIDNIRNENYKKIYRMLTQAIQTYYGKEL